MSFHGAFQKGSNDAARGKFHHLFAEVDSWISEELWGKFSPAALLDKAWAAAETEELYKKKYSPIPKHFWTSPKAGCSLVELADEIGVQDVLQ